MDNREIGARVATVVLRQRVNKCKKINIDIFLLCLYIENTDLITYSNFGIPLACNGVPRTDWNCCTSSNQCNVGGGDCDSDSECAGSLTCGSNNCRRDHSSSGSNWSGSADCCTGI